MGSKNKGAVLLLHGPNLNLLGQRESEHYGTFTLKDVENNLRRRAAAQGYTLESFQSNCEGALIDCIQAQLPRLKGMLINAGALTHYSYALLDALLICRFPIVEIHISNVDKREPFRRRSVIGAACTDRATGLGFNSYQVGWDRLVQHMEGSTDDSRP